MSGAGNKGDTPDVIAGRSEAPEAQHNDEPSAGPRNSRGWDGKLRVPKSAVLANPEALSDPEYSDDDNIMDGEENQPDEGAS